MSPKANITAILETTFNVYPNPSQGQFGLEVSPSAPGTLSITVTDLMGRILLNQNHQINTTTNVPVNLDFASQGQYIVKAEMNGEQFIKRVLLVK